MTRSIPDQSLEQSVRSRSPLLGASLSLTDVDHAGSHSVNHCARPTTFSARRTIERGRVENKPHQSPTKQCTPPIPLDTCAWIPREVAQASVVLRTGKRARRSIWCRIYRAALLEVEGSHSKPAGIGQPIAHLAGGTAFRRIYRRNVDRSETLALERIDQWRFANASKSQLAVARHGFE